MPNRKFIFNFFTFYFSFLLIFTKNRIFHAPIICLSGRFFCIVIFPSTGNPASSSCNSCCRTTRRPTGCCKWPTLSGKSRTCNYGWACLTDCNATIKQTIAKIAHCLLASSLIGFEAFLVCNLPFQPVMVKIYFEPSTYPYRLFPSVQQGTENEIHQLLHMALSPTDAA